MLTPPIGRFGQIMALLMRCFSVSVSFHFHVAFVAWSGTAEAALVGLGVDEWSGSGIAVCHLLL